MFCKYCGTDNGENARFCKQCGKSMTEESPQQAQSGFQTQQEFQVQTKPQPKNTYKGVSPGDSDATASMILGIISIVMCSSSILGIICGALAVVIAGKAKQQGSQSGNVQAGTICGVIGICLGALTTIYYIAVFLLGLFSALA